MLLNRNKTFDVISGLLIIEIISMHILTWTHLYNSHHLFWTIFGFYMPWFYFKSGYFYKCPTVKISFIEISKKSGFKRLIHPFIIFTIIGVIIDYIYYLYMDSRVWYRILLTPLKELLYEGSTSSNLPLWFLTSLFVVRFIAILLKDKIKWGAIIFLCIGFLYSTSEFKTIAGIQTLPLGLFFFTCGYIFKRVQLPKITYLLSIIILICIITLIPSKIDLHSCKIEYGNYFIFIIQCILGILLTIYIIPKLKISEAKIFNYIGRNSMTYYLMHWPIMNVTSHITTILGFQLSGIKGTITYFIILLITLPLLDLLINKYCQIIIGKNEKR